MKQVNFRTSRRAKKYTDLSFHFSVIEAVLNNGNMMILLSKLAIKPEGTRFCLLWTMK